MRRKKLSNYTNKKWKKYFLLIEWKKKFLKIEIKFFLI